MTPQDVQERARVILNRYPDAEFVLTDFGRGGKVVFDEEAGEEFVIYRPSWVGFKVLRSGPRKGKAIPNGKHGPEEIGKWPAMGWD